MIPCVYTLRLYRRFRICYMLHVTYIQLVKLDDYDGKGNVDGKR